MFGERYNGESLLAYYDVSLIIDSLGEFGEYVLVTVVVHHNLHHRCQAQRHHPSLNLILIRTERC